MQQSLAAFLILLLPFLLVVDGFSPSLHGGRSERTICKVASKEQAHIIEETSDWVQDSFNKLEGFDGELPHQPNRGTGADWFMNAMANFAPPKQTPPPSTQQSANHEWFTAALLDDHTRPPPTKVSTNDDEWVPSSSEWFSRAMENFVPPPKQETSAGAPTTTMHGSDWFSEASMNYQPPVQTSTTTSRDPLSGLNEWFSQALAEKK